MEFCADCHGENAKGHGPVEPALKVAPPDLTTLAKRHDGKFPADYVKSVLVHGIKMPAHGSSEMPVWGKTFTDSFVRELTQYLESMQAK